MSGKCVHRRCRRVPVATGTGRMCAAHGEGFAALDEGQRQAYSAMVLRGLDAEAAGKRYGSEAGAMTALLEQANKALDGEAGEKKKKKPAARRPRRKRP